jgi:hypothetical protein
LIGHLIGHLIGRAFIPLLFTLGAAHAQEITTHHLMQAICQVETGCVWIAPGQVKGKWREGSAREVSPWQLAPAVLIDLGVRRSDVRGSCGYAQQCVERWLWLLQSRGLTPREVAAAYHRGYSGRNKPEAKAYAERVINLATWIAEDK